MYLLCGFIVAGLFLKQFLSVSFVEVHVSEISLAYELRTYWVLAARHERASYLCGEVVFPVGKVLVGSICIVIVFRIAFLMLVGIFISESESVAKFA